MTNYSLSKVKFEDKFIARFSLDQSVKGIFKFNKFDAIHDSDVKVIFYNEFDSLLVKIFLDSDLVFNEMLANKDLKDPILRINKLKSVDEIGFQFDSQPIFYLDFDTTMNYLKILHKRDDIFINYQPIYGSD